jgi:hypothetical protein
MLRTLHRPEPSISSDYEHSILKSHNALKWLRSSTASGKLVPQLGEQKNLCPPLQVFPEVQYDTKIVTLYKEATDAHGMSIAQYLSQYDFPTGDIAYKYRHGNPLVRSEEIPNIPTRMRKLHRWYMEASKEGKKWITLGINDEHYFHGTDDININFSELFQLYNHDGLDKSLVNAYCL